MTNERVIKQETINCYVIKNSGTSTIQGLFVSLNKLHESELKLKTLYYFVLVATSLFFLFFFFYQNLIVSL